MVTRTWLLAALVASPALPGAAHAAPSGVPPPSSPPEPAHDADPAPGDAGGAAPEGAPDVREPDVRHTDARDAVARQPEERRELGGDDLAAAPHPRDGAVDHHSHRVGVAFRIIAGSSRAYPDETWVFGFGLAGEVLLAPHWELVLGTAVLLGENAEVLPVELLLKHIVTLEDRVSLHVAAGPLSAVVFEHGQDTVVFFGGTTNVGVTFWQTESFGILIEAAYQLIAEEHAVHDIEGAVGVSWRH